MDNPVYCPKCQELGRLKLLFMGSDDLKGSISIKCRGCREEIRIAFKEPMSRVSK